MEVTLHDPAIPDVADVHSFNQGQAHALAALRAVCVEKIAESYNAEEDFSDGFINTGKRVAFQEIINLIDNKEHHGKS